MPVKIRSQVKRTSNLTFFWNSSSFVEIRATVIPSEGYDNDNLNKVRRYVISST